jgi:hypothetical protein
MWTLALLGVTAVLAVGVWLGALLIFLEDGVRGWWLLSTVCAPLALILAPLWAARLLFTTPAVRGLPTGRRARLLLTLVWDSPQLMRLAVVLAAAILARRPRGGEVAAWLPPLFRSVLEDRYRIPLTL